MLRSNGVGNLMSNANSNLVNSDPDENRDGIFDDNYDDNDDPSLGFGLGPPHDSGPLSGPIYESGPLGNGSTRDMFKMSNTRDHHLSYRSKLQKGEKPLTHKEKRFMLCAERGDCASVAKMIDIYLREQEHFNINCMDPLGRTALSIAIINENPELMEILLENDIKTYDSLLLAIEEEYVEGVEILLEHEERIWKRGSPHSWEAVDPVYSSYTPDITPLILAAHKNNYEILRILLDQGATLPQPHDIKCSCQPCLKNLREDSLRYSLSRLNAYRALSSPSLISLTSTDPILTAFKLSTQLRSLAKMEAQFCQEYTSLREQVQSFATSLLDHARSSYELEVIMNFNGDESCWTPGNHHTLDRLKLAIKSKQKSFVAHHTVQQLLASIWYEGVPGFRRFNIFHQIAVICKLGLMYPIYCIMYILAPNTKMGDYIRNPFVKFLCHSASYIFFLFLLAMASQRIEYLIAEILGVVWEKPEWIAMVREWERTERGSLPSYVESCIMVWQICLIWKDIKSVYKEGLREYVLELWNLADWFTNLCFINWIVLRFTSCYIVNQEIQNGGNPHSPREEWGAYDPYLLSEGMFGAGMISSYLKIVHILSVNPHLGPLQISLGRMLEDILKFFCLFCFVCFAFACGMNQLLWYYAVLEKRRCTEDEIKMKGANCLIWKRFSNLFETLQSLYWSAFGLISLSDFELAGIKEFTQFWAKLMFGVFSFSNVIVLLNMLIAMMSNSYQKISERSDKEWKFARTKLWLSYFEAKYTLPPPFNICPTVKLLRQLTAKFNTKGRMALDKNAGADEATTRHQDIMRCVVRRYIMAEQKKAEDFGITEDDVSEIRQDINKFRFELMDILSKNSFDIGQVRTGSGYYGGKRAKQMERRILKGFNISQVEDIVKDVFSKQDKTKAVDIFQIMAEALNKTRKQKKNLDFEGGGSSGAVTPSGSRQNLGGKAQYTPATMLAARKFKKYIKKPFSAQNETINPEKRTFKQSLSVPASMLGAGCITGNECSEGDQSLITSCIGTSKTDAHQDMAASEATQRAACGSRRTDSDKSMRSTTSRNSSNSLLEQHNRNKNRSPSIPGQGVLSPSDSIRLSGSPGSFDYNSEILSTAIIPCSITLKEPVSDVIAESKQYPVTTLSTSTNKSSRNFPTTTTMSSLSNFGGKTTMSSSPNVGTKSSFGEKIFSSAEQLDRAPIGVVHTSRLINKGHYHHGHKPSEVTVNPRCNDATSISNLLTPPASTGTRHVNCKPFTYSTISLDRLQTKSTANHAILNNHVTANNSIASGVVGQEFSLSPSSSERKILPYTSASARTITTTISSRGLPDDQKNRLQALRLQPTAGAASGGWI